MFLHTPVYLLFLLGAAGVYWLLPRRTWRHGWLLIASYVFYAGFDARFPLLLLGLTVATYAIGRALPGNPRARGLAWLSVGINLGALGLFKYAGFFLANVENALLAAGAPQALPTLRLLLPLGLSFYAFQSIAYTTEIYRGLSRPAPFTHLALYLAFFPKLIAGPLARPRSFLPQLAADTPRLSAEALRSALLLLLLGLFKKLVIADSLGVLGETAFRAAAWPEGGQFATPLYVQGFYLYAFQIFADFSGYTDIARASAMLLGLSLPENFRQPYLAATLTDFWSRWHMSLTQWFREYLYFPLSRWLLTRLGRPRATLAQTAANALTMALIGLWHGAAWTFVAWGLWHAALLTLENLTGYRPVGRWRRLAAGILTFHLVGIGWVLFRAESLRAAGRFLQGLAAFEQMHWMAHYLPGILFTAALVFGLEAAAATAKPAGRQAWQRWRSPLVIGSLVLMFSLAALSFARGGDALPFIYGQF